MGKKCDQKAEAIARLQILADQGLSDQVLSLFREEGKVFCSSMDRNRINETFLLSEDPELQKIADKIARDYDMTIYYAMLNRHPDPFFTMLTVLGVTPEEEEVWDMEKKNMQANKILQAYAYNFAMKDGEFGLMEYQIQGDTILRLC